MSGRTKKILVTAILAAIVLITLLSLTTACTGGMIPGRMGELDTDEDGIEIFRLEDNSSGISGKALLLANKVQV